VAGSALTMTAVAVTVAMSGPCFTGSIVELCLLWNAILDFSGPVISPNGQGRLSKWGPGGVGGAVGASVPGCGGELGACGKLARFQLADVIWKSVDTVCRSDEALVRLPTQGGNLPVAK
jgi:hypothetical protein